MRKVAADVEVDFMENSVSQKRMGDDNRGSRFGEVAGASDGWASRGLTRSLTTRTKSSLNYSIK